MAYRVNQTIGKHFAAPTVLDLTLPDGSKTSLTVQFRHTEPRPAGSKHKGDMELYSDAVVSITGIEDEAGNAVDPAAAVELVKSDDWLVAAICFAYMRSLGETCRQASAA